MKTYKFQPTEGRSRTVALWLILSMISDLLTAGLCVIDLTMLARLETLTAAEDQLWQMLGLLGFITVPVYLVNVVLICIWTYRATANAHAFRKGLQTSPGWAVGWYFIPFANLFKPLMSMKDVWRASFRREEGRQTPPDDSLNGWWAFWIISGISGNISFRLTIAATEASSLAAGAWIGLFSALTGIGAAWMLRSIVLRISAAQTETQALRVAAADAAPAETAIEVASD